MEVIFLRVNSAKSCVENILKQKKKDLLVEILKQVDPEIDNIDVFQMVFISLM